MADLSKSDLLIYWGDSEQDTFLWKVLQRSNISNKPGTALEEINHQDLTQSYHVQSETLLKADLSCLSVMAQTHNVHLILSSQDVVSAELDIPNRNPKLIRKAIPFMMEDEVATSVDSLFYAYKDSSKNKPVSIRGIEVKYLESLITDFEKSEIKLEQIILEQDMLLTPESGLNIILEEENCLVINEKSEVWNCHPDDFSWLIQKQLAQVSEENQSLEDKPTEEELAVAISLNIFSNMDMKSFVHDLPVGRFAPKLHTIENKQSLLTESFKNASVINLLQDKYEPQKEKSELGLFLARVGGVAAAIFIAFILFQSSKIYTLGVQKVQLDERKLTLYKQAFPTRKKPASAARAVKNMLSYMKSIGSSSDSSGFLSMLESSSQSLTDLNKVYPTNISYDIARNELRIDLIASSLVELDKFADSLKASGHQVERSSETQRGGGYSSRLTIRN